MYLIVFQSYFACCVIMVIMILYNVCCGVLFAFVMFLVGVINE